MTLGERIKELRKKNRMTQIDLAKALKVTKGTVSTWETNSRRPNFETTDALCELFNVSLDYLMGRSDDPSPPKVSDEDLEDLAMSQYEEDLTEYVFKYARLDQYGKDAVESIIRAEYSRCRAENKLGEQSGYSVSIRVKR